MTEFGTQVQRRRKTSAGMARRVQNRAAVRRVVVSLLPMAVFVVGALGYDQVAKALRGTPGSVPQRTASAIPAGRDFKAAVALPAVPTPLVRTGTLAAAAPVLPTLKDQRSLLDLSRAAGSERAAEPEKSFPSPAVASPVAPTRRSVELSLGSQTPLALGFKLNGAEAPGAYAVVRGIPQNATLSHGIAAGSDSWLIDGPDIERVQLHMRSGVPGELAIALTLMSQESRVLAEETLAVHIVAPGAPVAAAVHSAQFMPTPSLSMPLAAPPIDLPNPALVEAAAPVRDIPGARQARLRMALASNSRREPGGGSKLRFDIETSPEVPDGSYMILRGLPQQTAMSRGVSVGADVWLLTLAELAELEVRLPPSSNPSLTLGAKLVTVDGLLLAEQRVRVDQSMLARQSDDAASPAAMIAPTVGPAVIALAAAPVAATAPPAKSRTVTPAATASPARAPGAATVTAAADQSGKVGNPGHGRTEPDKEPAASAAPSAAAVAALARGRRMLEMGNIAVARPLLERAAAEGMAEAAALLGATYDAVWLRRVGTVGATSDPEKSHHWYMLARRLGGRDLEVLTAVRVTPGQRGPQR